MKFIGKAVEIVVLAIGTLVLAMIYIAALVISWIAAVACGMLLILTFFAWLGYEYTHSAASRHTLMHASEYVGLCALIVFVVHGLPLFFFRADSPLALDQPFDPPRL